AFKQLLECATIFDNLILRREHTGSLVPKSRPAGKTCGTAALGGAEISGEIFPPSCKSLRFNNLAEAREENIFPPIFLPHFRCSFSTTWEESRKSVHLDQRRRTVASVNHPFTRPVRSRIQVLLPLLSLTLSRLHSVGSAESVCHEVTPTPFCNLKPT